MPDLYHSAPVWPLPVAGAARFPTGTDVKVCRLGLAG